MGVETSVKIVERKNTIITVCLGLRVILPTAPAGPAGRAESGNIGSILSMPRFFFCFVARVPATASPDGGESLRRRVPAAASPSSGKSLRQ